MKGCEWRPPGAAGRSNAGRMFTGVRAWVLPERQRRSLTELADDLDLARGDVRAKQSAFWIMLLLSAVIAAGGVLTDSTATVIGAMIIAPLSTPIMGIALGAVQRLPDLGVAVRRSRCTARGEHGRHRAGAPLDRPYHRRRSLLALHHARRSGRQRLGPTSVPVRHRPHPRRPAPRGPPARRPRGGGARRYPGGRHHHPGQADRGRTRRRLTGRHKRAKRPYLITWQRK